jgi:hypothetical protein
MLPVCSRSAIIFGKEYYHPDAKLSSFGIPPANINIRFIPLESLSDFGYKSCRQTEERSRPPSYAHPFFCTLTSSDQKWKILAQRIISHVCHIRLQGRFAVFFTVITKISAR